MEIWTRVRRLLFFWLSHAVRTTSTDVTPWPWAWPYKAKIFGLSVGMLLTALCFDAQSPGLVKKKRLKNLFLIVFLAYFVISIPTWQNCSLWPRLWTILHFQGV